MIADERILEIFADIYPSYIEMLSEDEVIQILNDYMTDRQHTIGDTRNHAYTLARNYLLQHGVIYPPYGWKNVSGETNPPTDDDNSGGNGGNGGNNSGGHTDPIETTPVRYGYRINKNDNSPSGRVEYLYDAVGKTPAYMDFDTGEFDYGDWANTWFVRGNKPCMLTYDGTVDYYLNPNDYSKKEDGTDSDVANANYAGNAMASIPLCWVYRYEDDDYLYEIVSNVQYDENYKAYAHTRADGSIADCFYVAMFVGALRGNKLKSTAADIPALEQGYSYSDIRGYAQANGATYDAMSWSQKELIRTLLLLIGKSLNSQAVYGTGVFDLDKARTFSETNDKGQFCSVDVGNNNNATKVFHIRDFWGAYETIYLGIVVAHGYYQIKMTPENVNYIITSNNWNDPPEGMTELDFAPHGQALISDAHCGEWGILPYLCTDDDRSDKIGKYFCDGLWSVYHGPGSSYIGYRNRNSVDDNRHGFFSLSFADEFRSDERSYNSHICCFPPLSTE